MAYIDSELRNMRLVWSAIADRVLVAVLIVLGMTFASVVALFMGYGAMELHFRP